MFVSFFPLNLKVSILTVQCDHLFQNVRAWKQFKNDIHSSSATTHYSGVPQVSRTLKCVFSKELTCSTNKLKIWHISHFTFHINSLPRAAGNWCWKPRWEGHHPPKQSFNHPGTVEQERVTLPWGKNWCDGTWSIMMLLLFFLNRYESN